mgnify:CR=1 FL=1
MLKFSRLLIAVALLSLGFTQAVRAADGDTAYIVTYFDTAFADKDKARLMADAGFSDVQISVVHRETEAPHFETVLAAGNK